MKKATGKRFGSFFAAAVVLAIFIVPTFAKGGRFTKVYNKTFTASGVFTITTETSEEISAGVPETTAVSSAAVPTVSAAVTSEDAKEIALSHAGADSTSAVFTKAKLDKGVYELKFSDENGKYEYKISAADGTILDYDWEVRTPAGSAFDVSENQLSSEGTVTREQASQTALDAAGVSEETLKYLVCYVSWKNHVPAAYEVKFATRWETYHYTIDLDTGAILGSICQPHHERKPY